MSLKAKLEAVIYAAEEPVTLSQLSALFADEALEWKAAQQAPSDAQQTVSPESTQELLDLVAEMPVEVEAVEASDAAPQEEFVPSDGFQPASPTVAASPAVDLEAEEKRQAKIRDREVRIILRQLLDELIAAYASDDRGIEIKEIAGGYRMATKPECHDAARMFVKSLKPAMKLSLPALETLAVVAYKQPVTAPEVNEIRGVDSSGVFGSLLARKLIATAGRKQVLGRPILYKTTKEFLLRFGLKDVNELPSMEEFEKMAELEFDEPEGEETVANEILGKEGSDGNESSGPEFDEDPDQPEQENANPAEDSRVTAATADSEEEPAAPTPDTTEPIAEPAMEADEDSAEAAPAAPSPSPEQAETETVPHE